METVVFVVALVSLTVAVVMLAFGKKAVQSLGNGMDALPRKVDATLRDELRHHRTEASESVHRLVIPSCRHKRRSAGAGTTNRDVTCRTRTTGRGS